MLVYWRRATVPGMFASMLCGAGTMLGLYLIGGVLGYGNPLIGEATSFRPYFLLGVDPLIWSLAVSAIAGVGVSLVTRPCDDALISKYFDAETDRRSPACWPLILPRPARNRVPIDPRYCIADSERIPSPGARALPGNPRRESGRNDPHRGTRRAPAAAL